LCSLPGASRPLYPSLAADVISPPRLISARCRSVRSVSVSRRRKRLARITVRAACRGLFASPWGHFSRLRVTLPAISLAASNLEITHASDSGRRIGSSGSRTPGTFLGRNRVFCGYRPLDRCVSRSSLLQFTVEGHEPRRALVLEIQPVERLSP